MGWFISSFELQRPEDLSSQLEAAGCGSWRCRFRTDFRLQYVARCCISYIYILYIIYIYIIDNYYSMLSQASLVQLMRLSNVIYFAAEKWLMIRWSGQKIQPFSFRDITNNHGDLHHFLVPFGSRFPTWFPTWFNCWKTAVPVIPDRLTYQWRWLRGCHG
jgi:hypothetical protein